MFEGLCFVKWGTTFDAFFESQLKSNTKPLFQKLIFGRKLEFGTIHLRRRQIFTIFDP
jgi:hypothetical protein